MSTINSKNVQVGTSSTAAENFTLYQPATPDGTVRLAVGNSGATTGDVVTVNSSGVTVTGSVSATSLAGSGTSITALNASNLSTGTVGTARLGSGTADSTTYLRGDGSWQAVSTTPTTAQVLSATAGASAGAVGSYMFAKVSAGTNVAFGSTSAGSGLVPTGALAQQTNSPGGGWSATTGSAQSGTWRCMGYHSATTWSCGTAYAATIWLRIS